MGKLGSVGTRADVTNENAERPIDDVRAGGPPVVRCGRAHGEAVVVLDPSGEARHDELPATWREFAADTEVVWWRMPAAERMGLDGDVLLGEATMMADRLHLVAARTAVPRCAAWANAPTRC